MLVYLENQFQLKTRSLFSNVNEWDYYTTGHKSGKMTCENNDLGGKAMEEKYQVLSYSENRSSGVLRTM